MASLFFIFVLIEKNIHHPDRKKYKHRERKKYIT